VNPDGHERSGPQARWWWFAAIVCLLILAAAAATPAAAFASETTSPPVRNSPLHRSSLFGINAWSILDSDEALAPVRDSPLGGYRVAFSWRSAEPEAGVPYDFDSHDRLVAAAARVHLRLLPVLIDSPPWVSGDPSRPSEPPEPGYEMERFELFAAAVARRFGHGGSFWREHPELPFLPMKQWEVWNEPNFPSFWYAGRAPQASEYRLLLTAARRGLQAGDRRARIIFGGLAYGQAGVRPTEYMKAFLREPGAGCLFDEVAIHPYSRSPGQALRAVQRMRRQLDRAGRRDAGLWLTEYGWSTSADPGQRFHVSEAGQKRKLARLTLALVRRRRELRLRGIYWFALRDAPPESEDDHWWGWGTGLLRVDGTPKPAFERYLQLAQVAPKAAPAGHRRCVSRAD
jgi:hypothetical protein